MTAAFCSLERAVHVCRGTVSLLYVLLHLFYFVFLYFLVSYSACILLEEKLNGRAIQPNSREHTKNTMLQDKQCYYLIRRHLLKLQLFSSGMTTSTKGVNVPDLWTWKRIFFELTILLFSPSLQF